MDVKRCMEGGGGAWMQVRQDMNGSKTHIMIPGCLRLDLDGHEMQFSGPAWRWDMTWMEVRRIYWDLHWDELRPGWMWDVNIMPGLYNLDQPPSRWQITSIKVPNSISVPPSTHINAIQVSSLSKSYLTYICVLVPTLYTYHLIFIMVPRLSSLLHPFHVSPAS